MTITCFLCVKDGVEFIEAWLENTKPADRVIIQDGGSTDGTLDILKEWAETEPRQHCLIKDNELWEKFKWDEAKVRNSILPLFATDWILLQDVDELIEDSFWEWFRNTDHADKIGYYIGHYNLWLDKSVFRMDPPWYPDLTLRLFRPKDFQWVGAEHASLWQKEPGQLVVCNPNNSLTPVAAIDVDGRPESIHFVHYHRAEPGYRDAVLDDKIPHHSNEKRNMMEIPILARLRQHPTGAGLIRRRFNDN